MATKGGRMDFMFLAPPLTRPLDPLLKRPTPEKGICYRQVTFWPIYGRKTKLANIWANLGGSLHAFCNCWFVGVSLVVELGSGSGRKISDRMISPWFRVNVPVSQHSKTVIVQKGHWMLCSGSEPQKGTILDPLVSGRLSRQTSRCSD